MQTVGSLGLSTRRGAHDLSIRSKEGGGSEGYAGEIENGKGWSSMPRATAERGAGTAIFQAP